MGCHRIVMAQRSQLMSQAIRTVKACLGMVGILAYHLGLARLIIGMHPGRVRTLLYHAVEDRPGSYTAGLGISHSTAVFERHLRYFRSHYQVLPLNRLMDQGAAPCTLIITFDDGYVSVAENALPLLEKYELSATVYLIGQALRGQMVWVNYLNHALNAHLEVALPVIMQDKALKGLDKAGLFKHIQETYSPQRLERLMAALRQCVPLTPEAANLFCTPQAVLAMQSRGLSFGFHTNNHYNLRLCDNKTLNAQLDSRDVAHCLNSNSFAYPFGYQSEAAARKLEHQAYQHLMTVRNDEAVHCPLHMPRTETSAKTAAGVFAQLEVVEPVMAWLRRLDKQTALKNDIPETSKPR